MSRFNGSAILKVSDPIEVKRRGYEIYNRPVFLSYRKYKKYMIEDDNGKYRHFGDMRYEDGTYHKNPTRILSYHKRMSNIKGNWRNDPFSPNILSLVLTW
jgi:hypothetical protein